jgi:hypothetical protein
MIKEEEEEEEKKKKKKNPGLNYRTFNILFVFSIICIEWI